MASSRQVAFHQALLGRFMAEMKWLESVGGVDVRAAHVRTELNLATKAEPRILAALQARAAQGKLTAADAVGWLEAVVAARRALSPEAYLDAYANLVDPSAIQPAEWLAVLA